MALTCSACRHSISHTNDAKRLCSHWTSEKMAGTGLFGDASYSLTCKACNTKLLHVNDKNKLYFCPCSAERAAAFEQGTKLGDFRLLFRDRKDCGNCKGEGKVWVRPWIKCENCFQIGHFAITTVLDEFSGVTDTIYHTCDFCLGHKMFVSKQKIEKDCPWCIDMTTTNEKAKQNNPVPLILPSAPPFDAVMVVNPSMPLPPTFH
jgi:hypothetical protein